MNYIPGRDSLKQAGEWLELLNEEVMEPGPDEYPLKADSPELFRHRVLWCLNHLVHAVNEEVRQLKGRVRELEEKVK